MSDIPAWLTHHAMEQTVSLGREMETFLLRGMRAEAVDPTAGVEPHPELLALIEAIRSKDSNPHAPIEDSPV